MKALEQLHGTWQVDNGINYQTKLNNNLNSMEDAKSDFMDAVRSLNYMVNHVGMDSAITRTWVRDSIEKVNEKFALYIKELVDYKINNKLKQRQ